MIISLQTFSLSILQPIVSLTDVYNQELQNYQSLHAKSISKNNSEKNCTKSVEL